MTERQKLLNAIGLLIDGYCVRGRPTTPETLTGYHIDNSSSYPGDIYISLPRHMVADKVVIGGMPAKSRPYSPRPNTQFWYVKGSTQSLSGKKVRVWGANKKYYELTIPRAKVTDLTKEDGGYYGRGNGDRATWYFKHNLLYYPRILRVVVPGFMDRTIQHNGKRYDNGGLLIKQSDARGRGMAILVDRKYKGKDIKVYY